MGEDPGDYRARSREQWEHAAAGWHHQAEWWDRMTRPVSEWLIEALGPQPGQTIVEVGAGPGDVGLLLAELIQPGGRVLITDGAAAMVEAARQRAKERGITNVEVREMEVEWIDLSAATVDSIVGRWAYMLLADPDAALRETRRVLRPGGLLALAAWDIPQANPWNSVIGGLLVERGLVEQTDPDDPGPFSWRERATIADRLGDAGFTDVTLDTVHFTFDYPDADAWWDTQIDCSPSLGSTLARIDPAARDELMEAAQARVADYVEPDGRLVLPASTHVARGEA